MAVIAQAGGGSRRHAGAARLFALLVVAALAAGEQSAALAQATATPGVPAGPPVDISGEWSITRTYVRRCPGCSTTIIRTTPWRITQSGADVTVDRGLKGVVTGSGPAYLTLEGTESEGFGAQRFWYATLHVNAAGTAFEGSFNGSERIQNPCGSDPPTVSCFVSAGWIRAVWVRHVATPVGAPGATATPLTPTATATTPPSATSTPTPAPLVAGTPTSGGTVLASGGGTAYFPRILSRRGVR